MALRGVGNPKDGYCLGGKLDPYHAPVPLSTTPLVTTEGYFSPMHGSALADNTFSLTAFVDRLGLLCRLARRIRPPSLLFPPAADILQGLLLELRILDLSPSLGKAFPA